MILGQVRTSFTPPVPPHAKSPHTGFYSGNIWPFSQVMHRMHAFPQYRPPMNPHSGPQMLPAPPVAVPTPGPGSPAAVQAPSSAPAMHGLGSSGFGSTGGVKAHRHHGLVNPYMTMRSGYIPNVKPSGSNIRYGVRHAGAIVHRSMPFQTAPLAPLPPPPVAMPAPMPAATHGFGYAHGGRRRHWLSRMWQPETVAEVEQRAGAGGCETYPPRTDGIKVTVCNGRVVKYEDAQGNVSTPESGLAGFGFPYGRGQQNWGSNPRYYGGGGGGYRQGGQQYGMQPHHRHHHHMWQQQQDQQQDAPPDPAPVPSFGRYW